MTVADRVLAVVGCVEEVPQQGGDGSLVAIAGRHIAHVLQIDCRPIGIDVEAERGGAGHDRAGDGLIVVGVPLAEGQAQAVCPGVDAGQAVSAAGVLVATELVVGEVAPLVHDDRIIPLVGAGRVVGDDHRRAVVGVEGAFGPLGLLPVDGDGAIHGRRVGGVVVPEPPRPVERIGDVKHLRLYLVELVDGQVEVDVAAFRFQDVGIPAVQFLLVGLLDAGDQAVAVPHLGADAKVQLQFIVENAVVVAEVEAEAAGTVGDGVAVGVVGELVLLAHLHQDVVDGHGRALLLAILAHVPWRRPRRQARLREHLGKRHSVLAGQGAADGKTAVGRARGRAGQMGLVDGGPRRRRCVNRRARVEVGDGRAAVAHVEEQHAARGQRDSLVGKVKRPGAHLVDVSRRQPHLAGVGHTLARGHGAESVVGRAAKQLAAVGQLPFYVDVWRVPQGAGRQGQGDEAAGRGCGVGRQGDLDAVVGSAGAVDKRRRRLRWLSSRTNGGGQDQCCGEQYHEPYCGGDGPLHGHLSRC